MKITKEICTFDELWEQSWSGAIDTLKTIMLKGKEEELIEVLEESFPNGTTETNLNDYLWFERDEIFEMLGIEEY